MTKYIAIAVIIIIAAIVYFASRESTVEYIKETVTETKEIEVDALEAAVREAIAASSTDIEAKAKSAYDDAKRQAEVEIELQVTAEYREKIEAREKELQKEASF